MVDLSLGLLLTYWYPLKEDTNRKLTNQRATLQGEASCVVYIDLNLLICKGDEE